MCEDTLAGTASSLEINDIALRVKAQSCIAFVDLWSIPLAPTLVSEAADVKGTDGQFAHKCVSYKIYSPPS